MDEIDRKKHNVRFPTNNLSHSAGDSLSLKSYKFCKSCSKREEENSPRLDNFIHEQNQKWAEQNNFNCPMVDKRALPVAENLGIEVYSYAEDVPIYY